MFLFGGDVFCFVFFFFLIKCQRLLFTEGKKEEQEVLCLWSGGAVPDNGPACL